MIRKSIRIISGWKTNFVFCVNVSLIFTNFIPNMQELNLRARDIDG